MGEPGAGPQEGPLTFYFRSPGAAGTVARRSLYSRPGTPGTLYRGPRDSHTCTQAHTHRCKVVCPSVHPCQVSGLGCWPQWSVAHPEQQQHGGPGPTLTLAGVGPFTSGGPHCWVGPGAAGRGQTRSRPLRSWSWGCPGHPASTARRAPTGPGTPAGGQQSEPWPLHPLPPAAPARGAGPALTSVDVTVRMRSRSSTSCLKVGRCEGAACQHSRMIMYLGVGAALGEAPARATLPSPGQGPRLPLPCPGGGPHRSCVQLAGLSMRWPSFSSLKSSSTGMPGYGEPPRVKISQSRTPKDHLRGSQRHQPPTGYKLLGRPRWGSGCGVGGA